MLAIYKLSSWAYLFISWVLLFSGFAKLFNLEAFKISLLLLPYDLSAFFAILPWFVPLLEIGLAILLWYRPARFLALLLVVGLLLLFTSLMVFAHTPDALVTCACFGYLHDMSLSAFLVRNVTLIVITICGIYATLAGRKK